MTERDEIKRYLFEKAASGNDLLYSCRQARRPAAGVVEKAKPREEKKENREGRTPEVKKKERIKISEIETGIRYDTAAPVQDKLFSKGAGKDDSTDLSGHDMETLAEEVGKCRKCPLSGSRTNTVFGAGDPSAGVVFVGEAPGREEDLSGIPFVGRAGKLLDKILQAIEFSREQVFIANILKCRPPDNRDPNEKEVAACEPFLQRQLELIEPDIICALGRVAAQTLLRTRSSLGKMRGKIHYYNGIKMIATYHPAALLRNPNFKRPAWEDMKMLRSIYDSSSE